MPRARQGTQAPASAANQAYGMSGEQQSAQADMPLPAAAGVPQTGGGGAPPPGAPPPAAGAGPPPGIEQALAINSLPTPLGAPSSRGNEPVTAGLAGGPGPGPEAMMQGQRSDDVADTLEMMAAMTGDTGISELASIARHRTNR